MQKLAAIIGTGLVLAGAAAANAGVSVDVRIGAGQPYPPPLPPVVYTPTADQVWVPAVTQTVVQNVWHEPVTEDRVSHTWLPDRYEVRNVPVIDARGVQVLTQQSVLVEPGHWQDVHNPVVVRAGYYGPEAQTVVVTPGYWETVQRPVFVRGYGPPPPLVVYREGPWRDHYGYYDHRYDRGYRR